MGALYMNIELRAAYISLRYIAIAVHSACKAAQYRIAKT